MKTPLVLLALAAVQLSAWGADLTGTWTAEFDTQVGLQKYIFEFEVEDGKVTAKGTAETGDQKRNIEFQDAKLTGDTLAFVEMRQIQDREIVALEVQELDERDSVAIDFSLRELGLLLLAADLGLCRSSEAIPILLE